MKIEAGKYYVTRGGDVVGPMVYVDVSHQYKWRENKDIGWWEAFTDEGFYINKSEQHRRDLIKEHVMPKFKVGDRVRRGVEEGNIVKFRPYEYVTIEMDDGCRFDAPADQLQAIPSVPPLDLTKPVQTRDGRNVRVLCTDGPGELPVVGFIGGGAVAIQWPVDGRYPGGGARDLDLINAPRTFERWFNVYASEDTPTVILTLPRMNRKDADAMSILAAEHGTDSNFRRIARKRVVFTEGEWDE